MKIYQVIHLYETDGGFGDAISQQDIIATFENYDDAKAFADRFSNDHVYDKPYSELHCGKLEVYESDVFIKGELNLDEVDKKAFWWLNWKES